MSKIFIIIVFLSLSSIFLINSAFAQTSSFTAKGESDNPHDSMHVVINTEGHEQSMDIPLSEILFKIVPHYDATGISSYNTIELRPDMKSFYSQVGFSSPSNKTVFVYPIFTQAAYGNSGFYDYYKKTCDARCLTVPIPDQIQGGYSSSFKTASILTLLNYSHVTDVDIDKNPDILKKYDRVIVLHNEYVTKKEFDAITAHPDVIFLFPNALYAEVKTDYDKKTITLVRGHGYPDPNIRNGFDWKYDNSKNEYDALCNNWTYYRKANYSMLNCYPEYRILYTPEMLVLLQHADPTQLLEDTANWLRYPDNSHYTHALLADYDINGTYIPRWVENTAQWVIDGEMKKSEFLEMLDYLYKNNIIQ